MKLCTKTTSERGKEQVKTGNEYIKIDLLAGNQKEPCWMGSIILREIALDKFQVFYTAPIANKKDKSGILYEANTKGTVFQAKADRHMKDQENIEVQLSNHCNNCGDESNKLADFIDKDGQVISLCENCLEDSQ